ncbi:MAG: hypothetical protein R6U92_02055 [Bacillota bacterium]
MITLRKWLFLDRFDRDVTGIASARTLALWTLIVVLVFLLGRSLINNLRPHVQEGETRRELEYEVDLALRYIDMIVEDSICARVEDDGSALSVWERPYEREAGLGEMYPHQVRFQIDDSGDLVAEKGDYTRVIAPNVEFIEFHLLDPRRVGIVLDAQADGEMIEIRHLGELKGEFPE